MLLVSVSDEVEQSPEAWSSLVDDIVGIAPTATITAIVGPLPDGCATADPGTGYYDAAIGTGGAFLSICADDWSPYFETIATMTASGQLDTFHLTSEPDPLTLAVTVDEIEQATGWSYDEANNTIVFASDSVPEPGAHLIVSFDLAGDCEG